MCLYIGTMFIQVPTCPSLSLLEQTSSTTMLHTNEIAEEIGSKKMSCAPYWCGLHDSGSEIHQAICVLFRARFLDALKLSASEAPFRVQAYDIGQLVRTISRFVYMNSCFAGVCLSSPFLFDMTTRACGSVISALIRPFCTNP